MSGRLQLAYLVAATMAIGACDCQDKLGAVGSTKLTIVSPTAGTTYGAGQTFTFEATASNPIGLVSLALYGGPTTSVECTKDTDCASTQACDTAHFCISAALNICKATTGQGSLSCSFSFSVDSYRSLIAASQITLTAIAVDAKQTPVQKSIAVDLKPLTIVFTEPTPYAGSNPPVANVEGTSPISVAVTSAIAIAKVVIVSDTSTPVASWLNDPSGSAFAKSIDWAMVVGGGLHHLTATATDIEGNVATATLGVQVGVPRIMFTAPAITPGTSPAEAEVGGTSPVSVSVVAPVPLSSVVITYDNGTMLASWLNGPTGTSFSQSVDWLTTMGMGLHHLTATETCTDGETATATLDVFIGTPTIAFTRPSITSGTAPPVADVSGTSLVAVKVSILSGLALTSIVVTAETGMTVTQWTTNLNVQAYQSNVDWSTAVGLGPHTLTATGTWSDGETATATISILVGCGSDADCPSGDRCCSNDGTCNPIVTENGDCDCDHPCPLDQGCFPGVCGATPSQCRPGCFPGSQASAQYPNGALPATCAAQNGSPAFCNPLPADQATTQNKGGACAVGDNCNVTMQNCPMMPADRSQPQSATNPLVAYNCLPVAPNLTGCFPAGTVGSFGTGCTQNCGGSGAVTSTNCAAGYECVQSVDSSGNPLGPASCEKQCATPSASGLPTNECSNNGQETCINVYQPYGPANMVFFSSGSCCVLPLDHCTESSECCDGKCNPSGLCD